jgi:hypothetical protein
MGFGLADGPGGGEVKVAKLTAGRGCCWLGQSWQSTSLRLRSDGIASIDARRGRKRA